ncbi:MAG: hypothetical protein LBH82_05370 [Bacteroidales bacterium]|jgi:hypothetical protein|nr:hypothetical protein [Bacteroidales bacterium]
MTRIFIIISILLGSLSGTTLSAQESYLKKRWNIKLSCAPYAKNYNKTVSSNYEKLKADYTADFRLEGNYGVLNFLEVGTYLGYAQYRHAIFTLYDNDNSLVGAVSQDGHFLSYGVQGNLHIFPFFIKMPDFRFDLYVTAKYGGRSSLTSKDYPYEHEWATGLGFAFYFAKHAGIFAEYSFGKFYIKDSIRPIAYKTLPFFPSKSIVRAGLSIKFKPKKN